MICTSCNAKMVLRRSRKARYEAPVVYVCPICGNTILKQGEEVKQISQ